MKRCFANVGRIVCVKSLTLLKSANVICDSAQLHCCCYCCTATALLLLHISQL